MERTPIGVPTEISAEQPESTARHLNEKAFKMTQPHLSDQEPSSEFIQTSEL